MKFGYTDNTGISKIIYFWMTISALQYCITCTTSLEYPNEWTISALQHCITHIPILQYPRRISHFHITMLHYPHCIIAIPTANQTNKPFPHSNIVLTVLPFCNPLPNWVYDIKHHVQTPEVHKIPIRN